MMFLLQSCCPYVDGSLVRTLNWSRDQGVAKESSRMSEQLSIEVMGHLPVVVRLRGELDMNTVPDLDDAIAGLDGEDLVLDCHELSFLDSSGISLLVRVHRRRQHNGHSLVLRNVSGLPRKAIELCGLADVLDLDPE